MLKSTRSLIPLLSTFLLIGCSGLWTQTEPIEVEEGALFCDIEEPRRFTQEELDVRAARWPANLRRDFKTNTAWDREKCGQEAAEAEPG